MFLSLFFGLQFCYSQYKPLLDQTNQWHFTTCYFGCLTDVYYTDGDTLVNGLNYKILDGFHYVSRTFLLREDSTTKKVYLKKINPSNAPEYLLYDFALQEGDLFAMTNPISPFPQNAGTFVLDSIRQKPLVNNVLYKHYYFSPVANNTTSTNHPVWIEGVGSKSMINAPSGEANINNVGHLSCFFKNSELVYSQLDSINACTYSALSNSIFEFEKLSIRKTSTKNIFELINAQKIKKVLFFDVFGKKRKEIATNNQEKVVINMQENTSGIYFVVVSDAYYRRKSFKIIVE